MLTSKLNLNSENKNSVETENYSVLSIICYILLLMEPSYPKSTSLKLSYCSQDWSRFGQSYCPFNFITRHIALLLSSLLKHTGFLVPSLSRH